jgi:mRNA interferase MazF
MTDYEFGNIILVPFPFTDQTTFKKRPATVASSSVYNSMRPDLVLMPITSQMRPVAWFGEVAIKGWKAAGLLRPSVIKPILTTLDKGLVLRKLGRLEQEDRSALWEVLRKLLGE